MGKNNLIAMLHALSGTAAIVTSLVTKGQIPVAHQPVRSIGFAIFIFGCSLFTYSLLYLRSGFGGNVDPVTEGLVTQGPYRIVRHPVYLAMLLMSLGLSAGLRSWLGIVLTLIAFLPMTVYRAMLEEAALAEKFQHEWKAYRERSHFLVPFLF